MTDRQEQLDKISELISNPKDCKLGLELVQRKELAVTAQDMCRIILNSTLLSYQKLYLAIFMMEVDTLLFVDTMRNNGAFFHTQTQKEWQEGKIVDAK